MNLISESLNETGWCKIENAFTQPLLLKLQNAINQAYEICRSIQVKNKLNVNTDGTVHHLLATKNDSFLELLEIICSENFHSILENYFEGKFILNSYGGVINIKDSPSYVSNIHRDVRFFTKDYNFMINALIMLDNFTLENGATHLLSGSHIIDQKPDEDFFYQNANRAIGNAGDIILFNSKIWHAAGINKNGESRRAITITLTKPFFKPQFDYSKLYNEDELSSLSDSIKQVLGYYSRIPSTLEEWYQPSERRFYRSDQN